jgi:hypothetical protein
MSYSVCRFWAYDESKKLLGAGMFRCSYSILLLGLTSIRDHQALVPQRGNWLPLVLWASIILSKCDLN